MIAERKHLQGSESYSPLANKLLTTNVIRNGVKIQRRLHFLKGILHAVVFIVSKRIHDAFTVFTGCTHTQPLLFDIELAELAVILRSCEE